MPAMKTAYKNSRWNLIFAINISLIVLVLLTAFMRQTGISAARNAIELMPTKVFGSDQSTVTPRTILVGVSAEMAVDIANGAAFDDKAGILAAIAPQAEPLLSFAETAVSAESPTLLFPSGQIYKVQLESGTDVAAVIGQLEANPNVLFAEPDHLAQVITMPNDPLFNEQWGLSKINAPAAWNITTGSSTVVIAIIDSGLDTAHPDLVGRLWINPGEIAGNGIDDDNNGYIDDVHGWNMVDNNADFSDSTGHGTEVAGVIGATSNNGEGVAGICWNCRLMVLKVTQAGGVANYSDIIEAINYAALKGADVINLSLGGASNSVSLRLAVELATETSVVVAGAGNNDTNVFLYPAAYESVLAVAGTSISDSKVSTSNYGSWVDVTAPGETIITTFDGGSYGSTSGTSVAAPFASGLAGLLRSAYPNWSANTVRAQIMQTATAVDSANPGYEGLLGKGRIDAFQALTVAARPDLSYVRHTVDGVANGRPEPGTTIDISITLTNEWADAANVQAILSSADSLVTIVGGSSNYGAIDTFGSAANHIPFRVIIDNAAPYAHDLILTLNVTADEGYATAIPITLSTAVSEVYPPATITTQTWTNDRIYIINKETVIPTGETLTIEPGTIIRFDGAYSLRVNGQLIADGTVENPIWFTSNRSIPNVGDWGQIKFNNSENAIVDHQQNYVSGTILRFATIEYGSGIYIEDSAPYIAHNTIRQMENWSISANGVHIPENFVIANNLINGRVSVENWNGNPFYVVNNIIYGTLQANGPGGVINGNHISNSRDLEIPDGGTTGLLSRKTISVTNNVVENWDEGIVLDDVGTVTGNLLANNKVHGLVIEAGSPMISQNTIINNGQTAVYIQSGSPAINQNNLLSSATGILLNNQSAESLDATGNWWGSVNAIDIESAIYDGTDEFGLGMVNYGNFLSSPDTNAPAYIHNVDISPESPIGVETATFNFHFSRPMDQSGNPYVTLHWLQSGTVQTYTTANSGLVHDHVYALAIDPEGNKWFGAYGGLDVTGGVSKLSPNGMWTTYNIANSGLAAIQVSAIAIDESGNRWFATNNGVSKFSQNGTWTTYTSDNSDLPQNSVPCITPDGNGNIWFGSAGGTGVSRLNSDGSWTIYDDDFYAEQVWNIAVDAQGNVWFATNNGVKMLSPFGILTSYTTANSGLTNNEIKTVTVDKIGNKWFGTNGGVNLLTFDGVWVAYDWNISGLTSVTTSDVDADGNIWFGGRSPSSYSVLSKHSPDGTWSIRSGLEIDYIGSIAIDSRGNVWFGGIGAGVLLQEDDLQLTDNALWVNDTLWRATYDINVLVPRGDYSVTVTGVRSTDNMEVPSDSRFGFTVDYAGEITDQTPPSMLFALAGGIVNDVSGLEAFWLANGADSSITGYRYALGSAHGAKDIINWTTTSGTSIRLSGLGLVEGQRYWLTVQARNAGGLWSANVYSGFVAGQPINRVFLPTVMKR